jgi:phosphatidate cytidylyltransferase
MLRSRVLVVVVLLPIGLAIIYLGGWAFAVFVALVLGLAGREYARLFRSGESRPAELLVIVSAGLFPLVRKFDGFESAPFVASLIILASITYHLVDYERGRERSATDFTITLAGAFYLGWLGAYLVSLRELPGGAWWLLLVLPGVWLADSGAYFVGRAIGRHPLSPRLSPKKTWEGYIAGIFTGVLGTAALVYLWRIWAGPDFNTSPIQGAILGLLLGALPTLGDLGESMIKRQARSKDSGNLLPGHGGVFDRIDSWLWAAVIGYYFIVWITS